MSETVTRWGIELDSVGCPHCGAVYLVSHAQAAAACPNCFAALLVPQPARVRAEPPELVAPFTATPVAVTDALDQWARGVWLRPPELNGHILAGRLTRMYFPMWLVDGTVAGTWCAQMGYDYQVASSQEVFQNNQWTTRAIAETRIRWEPRAGQVERSYENQPAPALEEHGRLIKQVGAYAIDRAIAYSHEGIEAAAVRVPDVEPQAARPIAERGFNHSAESDCQTAAGAQHIDEWKLQAEYRNLNWTLLLLPLYTTSYTDDEGHVRPVFINGQSGQMSGVRRASQKQARQVSIMLGLGALVAFVLGLVALLIAQSVPTAELISAVLLIVGIGVAVGAPIPVIWAWQFNRGRE